MRIGVFTSIDGWGGSESYLLALMAGLRARGHDVVLLGIAGTRLFREVSQRGWECRAWRQSQRPEGDVSANRVAATGFAGVRSRLIGLVPFGIKLLLGNLQEARRLRRLMTETRPDVMHIAVNGYEAAACAARWAGIPSLAMCMITPPDEPYWLRRWLMRVTVRATTSVAAQSQACMNAWKAFARLGPARCAYVWNGVDVERFARTVPANDNRPGSPFRLVCAARLHPMKGIAYLIEAMALVGDGNITLDIYGEGEQEAELRQLATAKGVAERVRFCGQTESIENALAGADAFALTSVSHESGPAVLSEAMAAGLPLVTSDFGPLAEINANGETGLVVPVRDVRALAAAIRRLAGDATLRKNMGMAARKRAEQFFSADRMVNETTRIYRALVKT